MTEKSFYWSNVAIGDGVYSSYDDDEFSDIWRKLFCKDRTTQGVVRDYENELEVTNPSGNNIQMDTGAALVDGKFYEADVAVAVATISTPAVATRKDRVVLRKSWAAQTVRVAILTGVEGGAVPPLTQTDGVTWEIPLATITITTGAVITITDERDYLDSPMQPDIANNEWNLIEEITLAGTETSIDFENIPSTYRHLKIVGILRHQRVAIQTQLSMRINDDSGANYNHQYLKGANATASAAAVSGDTEIELGEIPADSGAANHAGYVEIDIPYYANTDFYKTVYSKIGNIPTTTLADFDVFNITGFWENTGGIQSISLFSSGAAATAFAANCKIALYGIN